MEGWRRVTTKDRAKYGGRGGKMEEQRGEEEEGKEVRKREKALANRGSLKK